MKTTAYDQVRGKAPLKPEPAAASETSSGTKSPDEHAQTVSGMFGRIAGWYDFLNHFLSVGQDYYWRYRLVRHVRPFATNRVLDLAAGTLDVSMEILRQHPESTVLAMDFARPMLVKGTRKIKDRAPRIALAQADGRRLPLPDASVDCVTISFGIRNILPREDAFREIHRVLVPGGRLCILEFGTGRQRIWGGLYNFYLGKVLPALGKLVSGDAKAYMYLADTIRAFPDADKLAAELVDNGFGDVFYRPMLSGIVYIHVGRKAA